MAKERFSGKISGLLQFIFFSNYFYGVGVVALSIEATLQQRFPLNHWLYFFLIFISTILYYTYPYVRKNPVASLNPRTNWYTKHYRLMRSHQLIIPVVLLIALALFLKNNWRLLTSITPTQWLLIFIFPLVAAFYYGITPLRRKFNLRKVGWLKPFIIGFSWAGLVTIYPVLFYDIMHELPYEFTLIGTLLFVKNLMFIAILCIMFDIKDHASDYIHRVRTFVVQVGLRKTLFYILLPLTVIGLGTFVFYAITHHFQLMKILLNAIAFILLIVVTYSLRRRRPLLYYLIVIDGLLLVKAACGIIAMIYF